jgi:hypothetical protein
MKTDMGLRSSELGCAQQKQEAEGSLQSTVHSTLQLQWLASMYY